MSSGIRILLVDDHGPRREATKYFLEQEGYQVTLAGNCDEARGLLVQDFELLMLDFSLHRQNDGRLAQVWRALRPASPMLLSGSPGFHELDDITRVTPLGFPIERIVFAVAELTGVSEFSWSTQS
jgi:DNA-binding response OmpR family regulator